MGREYPTGDGAVTGGLVGERKPLGKACGGEFAQRSICSGLIGALVGLVGSVFGILLAGRGGGE